MAAIRGSPFISEQVSGLLFLKHAFTRYCWSKTDLWRNATMVRRRERGAFTLYVGLFATPWLHPKGG